MGDAPLVYERRGDFDNSHRKDALVFRLGDKRAGLFASHDPGRIGVVVDGLTYTLSGAELLAVLERRPGGMPGMDGGAQG
jgi:hypothetical protein